MRVVKHAAGLAVASVVIHICKATVHPSGASSGGCPRGRSGNGIVALERQVLAIVHIVRKVRRREQVLRGVLALVAREHGHVLPARPTGRVAAPGRVVEHPARGFGTRIVGRRRKRRRAGRRRVGRVVRRKRRRRRRRGALAGLEAVGVAADDAAIVIGQQHAWGVDRLGEATGRRCTAFGATYGCRLARKRAVGAAGRRVKVDVVACETSRQKRDAALWLPSIVGGVRARIPIVVGPLVALRQRRDPEQPIVLTIAGHIRGVAGPGDDARRRRWRRQRG